MFLNKLQKEIVIRDKELEKCVNAENITIHGIADYWTNSTVLILGP